MTKLTIVILEHTMKYPSSVLRLVYIMRISYDQLESMRYLDHSPLKDIANHMVLHVGFLLVGCLTCS